VPRPCISCSGGTTQHSQLCDWAPPCSAQVAPHGVCQQSAAAHAPVCCGAPDAAAPAWLLSLGAASCRCCDCQAEGSAARHPAHTAALRKRAAPVALIARRRALRLAPLALLGRGRALRVRALARAPAVRGRARRRAAAAAGVLGAPPGDGGARARRPLGLRRTRLLRLRPRTALRSPLNLHSHRRLLQRACRGCASAHRERGRPPSRSPRPRAARAQRGGAHARHMRWHAATTYSGCRARASKASVRQVAARRQLDDMVSTGTCGSPIGGSCHR